MSSAAPASRHDHNQNAIWHAGAALDMPYTMLN